MLESCTLCVFGISFLDTVTFNYVGQGLWRSADGSYPIWYYVWTTFDNCQATCELYDECLGFDMLGTRCDIYVYDAFERMPLLTDGTEFPKMRNGFQCANENECVLSVALGVGDGCWLKQINGNGMFNFVKNAILFELFIYVFE